jgi:hypothetical protein
LPRNRKFISGAATNTSKYFLVKLILSVLIHYLHQQNVCPGMFEKITTFIFLVFAINIVNVSAQGDSINNFKTYDQTIPGTEVSFKMIAIPAGSFVMGSSENQKGHKNDEGPETEVKKCAN